MIVAGPISNTRLVDNADVMVRVTALEYAVFSSDPSLRTTGTPDSRVRFKVNKTIRAPELPSLALPGYLVERDNFNDHESPSKFVRPGGRLASCFANSSRKDGQFLSFLKKRQTGELTVNLYALAPVNEHLHSAQNPWLLWGAQAGRSSQEGLVH